MHILQEKLIKEEKNWELASSPLRTANKARNSFSRQSIGRCAAK